MNDTAWWLQRFVGGMPIEHGEERCDHRHFGGELNVGWVWRTPAGRLETITRIERADIGDYWWRVWTDLTGPGYSWRIRHDDRVDAIPRSWKQAPRLLFVDLPKGARGASMHVVPGSPSDAIPNFLLTLCHAQHLGAHKGWKVFDRPDGGGQVVTDHPTKAKARTALLVAGEHHATALGMTLYKEDDLRD